MAHALETAACARPHPADVERLARAHGISAATRRLMLDRTRWIEHLDIR
ncbi:hypothetical protein [Saccharothrix obliqua]|nr:hypothetical protein [Saccharothrix obliqua]MBW4722295.1 hypothetical protein [Saccharothrix obliqua]